MSARWKYVWCADIHDIVALVESVAKSALKNKNKKYSKGFFNEFFDECDKFLEVPLQSCYIMPSSEAILFIPAMVSDTKNLHFSTFWILQNTRENCWCSW